MTDFHVLRFVFYAINVLVQHRFSLSVEILINCVGHKMDMLRFKTQETMQQIHSYQIIWIIDSEKGQKQYVLFSNNFTNNDKPIRRFLLLPKL